MTRVTYVGGSGKLHLLDTYYGGPGEGIAKCNRARGAFFAAIPMDDGALRDRLDKGLMCKDKKCAGRAEHILSVDPEHIAKVEAELLGNPEQTQRRERLSKLAESYHQSRHGDYDDMYSEFADTYLAGADEETQTGYRLPIPRYASLAVDETYGVIHLFDDLKLALNDQANIPYMGETLNCPDGIVDLDTGKKLATVNVVLTVDTFNALGGIVAQNEGDDVLDGGEATNKEGIFCDWDELRAAFPLANFIQWAHDNDVEINGSGYDPEAGY